MRKILKNTMAAALAAAALTAGVGCSSMKSGSLASVAPVTQNERVGSVYLFRGWIGVFSTGIDSMGAKLNEDGVHAEVFQQTQWNALADAMIAKYENHPDHEPIVLIGHSYGADDTILVLRKLAAHNVNVDLVVTLDPVTPEKVTPNAQLVYNLYQSSVLDNMPFFRGIPLTPENPGPAELKNMNVRTDRKDLMDGSIDHFNIEKKAKIHEDVIAQVLKVCQPRGQWLASRGLRNNVVAQAAAANAASGIEISSARATPSVQAETIAVGDR